MPTTPRRKARPRARLHGLGTALPAHAAGQPVALRFARNLAAASLEGPEKPKVLDFLERLYGASGIERRHSVLPDYLAEDPEAFSFYPKNWALEPFPGTAQRMAAYERECVGLCERAARKALEDSGFSAAEVTHLVVVTCTGFFAPGPDILLISRLGLPPGVRRTVIGFMGCYAGFAGMRHAEEIAAGDPEAVILQVCVELCSLHFQKRPEPDLLVANSLFADGAAACVWSAPGRGGKGLADLAAAESLVAPDSLAQMSWRIGAHGFEMRLDRAIPRTLRRQAPAFVDALTASGGLARGEVGAWAVHPGGRRIVEEVQDALALGDAEAALSHGVLKDYGNMSSPTIFFVLERALASKRREPVAALGFGPGLTMEGALLLPS